jgi:uncharacterized protein YaeQ
MTTDNAKIWTEKVEKALVGKTIVGVSYMTPMEADDVFGWANRPIVLTLNDGSILFPSSDDEGNAAGSLFTSIDGLETIPVIR